jgi:acyl carrier protein
MPESLSTAEIVTLLRELIAELLEIGVAEVIPDADLVREQGVDSLQQLELMTRVEHRLHVTFDVETWLMRTTLVDLAEYICAQETYS